MKIPLTSVMVEDQAQALDVHTKVLGFVKETDMPAGGVFRTEPTSTGRATIATFEDGCGNLLQLFQVGEPAKEPR
jgi:hypothetical protein